MNPVPSPSQAESLTQARQPPFTKALVRLAACFAGGPADEKETAMLKKIMISAGLATIIATSAMALSYQPEVGSGNITPKK